MTIADPARVTGTFVPQARRDVASRIVGDEAVIFDAGSLHQLSPIATIVWQCCDGEVTVDELGAELAGAFGVDVDEGRGVVLATVAELTGRRLLVDRLHGAAPAEPATALVALVDPDESCASCAQHRWGRTLAFRIGSRAIGVGIDDLRAADAIAEALADHLIPTPDDLAPYYGLTLSEQVTGAEPQPFHALHRGSRMPVRSRDPRRVIDALLTHLAAHGELPTSGLGPGGLAPVPALVVGRADRVLLMPPLDDPRSAARALAGEGLQLADASAALVDRSTGEIVVGAPGLDFDDDRLAELAASLPTRGGEPTPLRWGRYELVAIVASPATPAGALLAFGPPIEAPARAVETLADLVERIPVGRADTVAEVARLLDDPVPRRD